jgi:PadR family transcriptional regulator PadR
MGNPTEILQGTLDLLILRTLELGSLHGVGIADRLAQLSRGTFSVGPGSLFPALHRLADKGWIEGRWGGDAQGRRVKTYTLTSSGAVQLREEKRNWKNIIVAMDRVLLGEA